jgi:tRNA nucleotidyltransferase (CCA-adding enzyme)
MDRKKLLAQVAKSLRPKQLQHKVVDNFVRNLQTKLGNTYHVDVMPGGSYAKGTFIAGSHDIDLFIRFPKGTTDEHMARVLIKTLPKAKQLHGSRDYLQIKHKGFLFELVPVLHIDHWKDAKNVMDMSPLHVAYIANHLTEKQKDDARLAKQFCKAANVYGAESFIRGFSGYVLELLISIYGSFEKLLLASRTWKKQVVLDPAKYYSSEGEVLRRLNEAKTLSPIILVDPVQPDRNAAAALSQEALNIFKEKAATFLKKPSKTFFVISFSKAAVKKQWKGKTILFVDAKTPKGKRDIVGSKVRLKHEAAVQLLKKHEFSLISADWRFDEKTSVCWYVLENEKLLPTREQRGPPKDMEAAVKIFRTAHNKTFMRAGRWYATVKREEPSAKALLRKVWTGLGTLKS